MGSNTAKWILEACEDKERNPHNLTASTVSNRIYRQSQSLEKALSYPAHNKKTAGKLGKAKSHWGEWKPGYFSSTDKEKRA